MRRSQSILLSSVLITGILTFSLGWFFAKNIKSTGDAVNAVTKKFSEAGAFEETTVRVRDLEEVWGKLQAAYYDASKLDLAQLEFGAVKGFVAAIKDPYSVFMTPEESKEFENGLEGQLEGIGAELEVKDGKLIVVAPLKNSPAAEAGILSGDIIYKINDELAEEMTLFEAIKKIRGKKGTKVTLTLIRENTPRPIVLTITRSEITIESITLKKLEGDIFHITINQFNDHTKPEFDEVVQQILLEKAKGIVLDVRGNGGGYLDTSVDILSELLAGQKPAAIIKKRDPTKNETVKTSGGGRLADIPLVVLIDKGSASASEIVAGAIQDYKRGLVIGEKTFGKGSVQELSELADGSRLRMTIAKWFTPLDRSIDDVGVTPDKEVKMTDEDRLAKRDPQLEEALAYLRAKK